jgi:hypothetical protein
MSRIQRRRQNLILGLYRLFIAFWACDFELHFSIAAGMSWCVTSVFDNCLSLGYSYPFHSSFDALLIVACSRGRRWTQIAEFFSANLPFTRGRLLYSVGLDHLYSVGLDHFPCVPLTETHSPTPTGSSRNGSPIECVARIIPNGIQICIWLSVIYTFLEVGNGERLKCAINRMHYN